MAAQQRDYALVERLSKLGDDVLVGVDEVAAMTGLAAITIKQRRNVSIPRPVPGVRRLRWRLGDIRTWMRAV